MGRIAALSRLPLLPAQPARSAFPSDNSRRLAHCDGWKDPSIDESEIAAIRRATGSGLPVEPWPLLKIGERVRLKDGPLTGLEGCLVEVRNQYRLVVSFSLLKRSVAVEANRQWLRPVDPSGRKLAIQIRPTLAAPPSFA
jgi:hypothetical protein